MSKKSRERVRAIRESVEMAKAIREKRDDKPVSNSWSEYRDRAKATTSLGDLLMKAMWNR